MLQARNWAIRHAGLLERAYRLFVPVLRSLRPLTGVIGYQRLEKPMARIESVLKGFLFGCKMCGQCTLSLTGMSCWKNCPKGAFQPLVHAITFLALEVVLGGSSKKLNLLYSNIAFVRVWGRH